MRKALVPLLLCASLAPGQRAGAAAGSVDRLADDVAVKAAGALAGVVTPGDRADVAVTVRGSGRLAATLEGLVVARLRAVAPGQDAVRQVNALPGGDATAARRDGYEYWLDAELVVAGGQIEILTKLVPTHYDLWAEAAGQRGEGVVTSTAHTSAKVDAEIKALLAAAPEAKPAEPAKPAAKQRSFVRPRRIEIDLGAEMLATAAADVDGDGKAELIALTTAEVVVVAMKKSAAEVRQRIALPGQAPSLRPRDPVGALLIADVDGDGVLEVLARASTDAGALRLTIKDGALVTAKDSVTGYPVCALPDDTGAAKPCTAELAKGMNWFARDTLALPAGWTGAAGALPERLLSLEGGQLLGVVDAAGKLRVFRRGDTAAWVTLDDAGTAFELADLDGDGDVELISSLYRPPGDGDVLSVRTLRADGSTRALFKGDALRGGIVAIATGDYNGDGLPDVAAAARLVGSTRIDLWLLE